MSKVLHIISTLNAGGIENLLMNIVRNSNLNKFEYDFVVIGEEVGIYEHELIEKGCKVFHLPPFREGMLKNQRLLKDIIVKNQYDVIHLHDVALPYIDILRFAKRKGIKKRILHSHSNVSSKTITFKIVHIYLKLFLNLICTDMIACSSNASIRLFGKKNTESKVVILNNGIDVDKYYYQPDLGTKIVKKYNLFGKKIVGHVGRFSEEKNHKFLISLFAKLTENDTNLILMLIGTGELEDEVKKQVVSLDIEDKVIFLGYRDNTNEFMQVMDYFIMPSYAEGLPLVLVEAQCADINVIASTGVSSESNILGEIKFCDLNGNINEWIEAFVSTNLKTKLDRREDVRNSGFDIKDTILKLEKIYSSIS